MAKNDTILVTPEILDSKAKDLQKIKMDHETNMKNLDSIVKSMESVWRGDSQIAYSDEYKALQKNATKVSNLLENYAKTITEVSNRMRQVNEQSVATVNKYAN